MTGSHANIYAFHIIDDDTKGTELSVDAAKINDSNNLRLDKFCTLLINR